MAPIVLQMEVNSMGCANKIEKAIKKMPGVTAVRPRVGEGRVVVEGTAVDAEALRARLESKLKKPVVVISTGVEPPPMQAPRPVPSPHYGAPPPMQAPQPVSLPQYGAPPPPEYYQYQYEHSPYILVLSKSIYVNKSI